MLTQLLPLRSPQPGCPTPTSPWASCPSPHLHLESLVPSLPDPWVPDPHPLPTPRAPLRLPGRGQPEARGATDKCPVSGGQHRRLQQTPRGAWTTGIAAHTLEPGTPDPGAQGQLLLRPVSMGCRCHVLTGAPICACLCPHLLLEGLQSDWTRARPGTPVHPHHLFRDATSRSSDA